MKRRRDRISWLGWGGVLTLLLGVTACPVTPQGQAQPEGVLRLPGALALSEDGRFLYVVGTNYDLAYDTGALQSLDLGAIDAAVAEAGSWPVSIDPSSVLAGEVHLGSFGGQIAKIPGEGGERLFVPSRGGGGVGVVAADGDGHLTCVLPSGADATAIGRECEQAAVALPTPGGEVIPDPYVAATAAGQVFVGALSTQAADPNDPGGEQVAYMAALDAGDPFTPEVADARGMLPRDLRLGPDGRLWAVGQVVQGGSRLAEVRAYDPLSLSAGIDGAWRFGIAPAIGGGEARALRFSGDGSRLYVVTSRPNRLVVLALDHTYGRVALHVEGAVDLPTRPAALERIEAGGIDLLAVTGSDPDALVIVDPIRLAVAGLLDGTHCDPSGVCPQGGRSEARRDPVRDPGVRPFGLVVTPQGEGVRIWVSAFGVRASEDGGLLAVDLRDPARPWELNVVAEVASRAEESTP